MTCCLICFSLPGNSTCIGGTSGVAFRKMGEKMAVGPREVGLQFLAVSSGAGHRLQGRSPWGRVFCSPPPPLWSEGVPPAGFGEHFRAHDSSENIGSRVTSFVLRGKRSLTNFSSAPARSALRTPGVCISRVWPRGPHSARTWGSPGRLLLRV